MPEQFGEKTHEATPHRRQQAREQGQVAKSQDLASALTLMGSVVALMFLGRSVVDYLGQLAHRQLGGQVWLAADRDFAVRQSHLLLRELGLVILPIFGIMLVLAVGVHIGQIGIVFVPQKSVPGRQQNSLRPGKRRLAPQ